MRTLLRRALLIFYGVFIVAQNNIVMSKYMQQAVLLLPELDNFNATLSISKTELANLKLENVENHKIELEDIDVERFRKKIAHTLLMYEEPLTNNISRRQAVIHYVHGLPIYHIGEDTKAVRIAVDLMLQLIYMSRHKMQTLQKDVYFEQKNREFRVAYSYRTCQRLRRTIAVAFKLLTTTSSIDISRHLILHHKMARLHLDFVYLFWYQSKVSNVLKAEKDSLQSRGLASQMQTIENLKKKKGLARY